MLTRLRRSFAHDEAQRSNKECYGFRSYGKVFMCGVCVCVYIYLYTYLCFLLHGDKYSKATSYTFLTLLVWQTFPLPHARSRSRSSGLVQTPPIALTRNHLKL